MTNRSRKMLGLLGAIALATSGCASAFMAGSAPASAAPASPSAHWEVTACKDAAGGTIRLPGAMHYYLESGPQGPALYEMDAGGKGARISNHWSDAEGLHFFTYVRTSHGFEMVVGEDRRGSGMRRVYPRGTYQVFEDAGGVLRPRGAPSATCEMTPR